MTVLENLNVLISENIKKAQQEAVFLQEIYSNPSLPVGKNEFLFFIKPEITLESDTIQLNRILEFIQDKILSFGFKIHQVRILSAKYLEQYNIIAQHYGIINRISTNAVQNMSDSAKEKFVKIYGKSVKEVEVLGGSEFLEKYSVFNAASLEYLWQNFENNKLAGGTYSEVIKMDQEPVYLLNGFHPMQLKHFTGKGRSIVVMTLSGAISWKDARNNFIGATDPGRANQGSLRRGLLDRKDEFGLAEVSQGVNGVHLSAGPVEALIELRRFSSDFSVKNGEKDFLDFTFGKRLLEIFNGNIDPIIENSNVLVSGKATSIFDLTEEQDSDEAICLLKKYV